MDEESPSEASRLPDALVPTVAHMYVLGETCGVNWNRSLAWSFHSEAWEGITIIVMFSAQALFSHDAGTFIFPE